MQKQTVAIPTTSNLLLGMIACEPLHARLTPMGCRLRQRRASTVARGILAGALDYGMAEDAADLGCLSACSTCKLYEGDRETAAKARTIVAAEYRALCRQIEGGWSWDVAAVYADAVEHTVSEAEDNRARTNKWYAENADRKREYGKSYRRERRKAA